MCACACACVPMGMFPELMQLVLLLAGTLAININAQVKAVSSRSRLSVTEAVHGPAAMQGSNSSSSQQGRFLLPLFHRRGH